MVASSDRLIVVKKRMIAFPPTMLHCSMSSAHAAVQQSRQKGNYSLFDNDQPVA